MLHYPPQDTGAGGETCGVGGIMGQVDRGPVTRVWGCDDDTVMSTAHRVSRGRDMGESELYYHSRDTECQNISRGHFLSVF